MTCRGILGFKAQRLCSVRKRNISVGVASSYPLLQRGKKIETSLMSAMSRKAAQVSYQGEQCLCCASAASTCVANNGACVFHVGLGIYAVRMYCRQGTDTQIRVQGRRGVLVPPPPQPPYRASTVPTRYLSDSIDLARSTRCMCLS